MLCDYRYILCFVRKKQQKVIIKSNVYERFSALSFFHLNKKNHRILMKYLSFIIMFLISIQISAQVDVGVIWMGFEHEWTYNHRLNRLGDYVSQPEFDGFEHPVKHYHTGATGLGWDEALFTSYYTVVKANGIWNAIWSVRSST